MTFPFFSKRGPLSGPAGEAGRWRPEGRRYEQGSENSPALMIGSFILLFLVLIVLIFPTFSNPPHVDYWEAFCVFHQVRAIPQFSVWPYIVNHDPWRHGTFRPLAYTILYLEHRAFGSSFVWNHVTNLFFYCLLLILLYFLGRRLGARQPELIGAIFIFAVLYSHCDILSLTFHIFLIIGFGGFVAAFLFYYRYLDRGNILFLSFAAFFSLLAMFCYESFFFWPLAFLILFFTRQGKRESKRVLLATIIMLFALYLLYGMGFILTRSAHYISGDLSSIPPVRWLTGLLLSGFNIIYTGIGVNIYPGLAAPTIYKGYSEMGGDIPPGNISWLIPAAWGSTLVLLVLFGVGVIFLIRKGERRPLSSLLFLVFLYLSNFTFLVAARSGTNNLSHILRQFRYQFIPNAIIILIAAVAASFLFSPTRKNRGVLLLLFLAIFLGNIYNTDQHIRGAAVELRPLRDMLGEIRTGMGAGNISPRRRVYIPDGLASSFPHLCWNRLMGRKMWGTYQWVFSPAELDCFTPRRKDAYWEVDMEGRIERKIQMATAN